MVVGEKCRKLCFHLMLDPCGSETVSTNIQEIHFIFQLYPFSQQKNQEAIDLHISACKRSRSKSLPCDDSEAESSDDDSLTKEEFEEFRKMIDAAAKVQEPPAAMKEKCPKCFQYECKCFST